MPSSFDYKTATSSAIKSKAQDLIGRRLDELGTGHDLSKPSSAGTKSVVGHVIEAYFGIERNSRAEPDFLGAGMELKSVPIQIKVAEARAKERISLGMIDWASLATETWTTARARHKLEHLFLVFYEWSPLRPIGYFEILAVGVWRPDEETIATIEQDWLTIRQLEMDGRRSEVSESLTSVLGAATKGAGHGSTSRAWSLKQPFVGWIYRSMAGEAPVQLEATVPPNPAAAFEVEVRGRLASIQGRSIAGIARSIGRPVGGSKAAAAQVVRAFLGEKSKGQSGDFARFGVEVKTIPIDGNGRPIEATSFPSFIHEELAYEDWPNSDLLGRLNRILFIPIIREKGQDQREAIVGSGFFWSPSEAELEAISIEWERFRGLISAGLSRELPKPSQTKYIHVRPKARDSRDREIAPGGVDVIRKCFWLNQSYVEQVIREHDRSS